MSSTAPSTDVTTAAQTATATATTAVPAKENEAQSMTEQENRGRPSRRPTSLTFVASPSSSPKGNRFEKEKVQVESIPQLLGVPTPPPNGEEKLVEERWAYQIGFPRWLILRKAAKSKSPKFPFKDLEGMNWGLID